MPVRSEIQELSHMTKYNNTTHNASNQTPETYPSIEQCGLIFQKLTNDMEELAQTVALLLAYVEERGDRISRLEAFLHQHDSGECWYARRCAYLESVIHEMQHGQRSGTNMTG